jgi:hypothetical protein
MTRLLADRRQTAHAANIKALSDTQPKAEPPTFFVMKPTTDCRSSLASVVCHDLRQTLSVLKIVSRARKRFVGQIEFA